MASINESIEQLTASLQELATHSYNHAPSFVPAGTEQVSLQDFRISEEVESFVETTRAYAEQTRNVSVGTY